MALNKFSIRKQILNYATMTYETHGVTDFPEYLVTNAKQLVDEAAEIYFTPRQTVGHQVFGDIHITKYCGTKIDLLHELMKSDSIKIADSIVPKGNFRVEKCIAISIVVFRF